MSKKKKKNSENNKNTTATPLINNSSAQPKVAHTNSRKRSSMLAAAGVALILIAAAGLYFFRGSFVPDLKAGAYKDYNVLLITLDTLRADRLPVFGYKDVKTPNLDRFASESFMFTDAISHVPLTLPSHTSMLTGKLPIGHGIRDNAGFILSPDEITFTEILKQQGYATGAFVSAFVLDSRWQLDQGFDIYYDNFNIAQFKDVSPGDIQRKAEETEVEASHWLEANKDRKFFGWVHYYDPHDSYDPPEPYKSEYAGRLYDGEIAYTDEYVGKLLDKLKDLGLEEKTIVIIASDHGEGLGDHQEVTHAMFIYNTTQHVPFFIKVPNSRKAKIDGVVRLVDMMPTLLELLGLQIPDGVQGKSLLPMMNGEKDLGRTAYSESIYANVHYGWSPLESITTREYKYIDAPDAELYNRLEDPGELKNLLREKPSIAKVLKDQLQEIKAQYSKKDLAGPAKMDPDTEEKLRALGYIGSTAVSTPESRKIDPKSKIHLARAIQESFDAIRAGKHQEGLDKIQVVLQEDPTMIDGHFCAGVAYVGLNKLDEGIDKLMQALAMRPNHTMAMYNIAYAYELKGDLNEARVWFEKVLQIEPKHQFAPLKLAHIYRQLNMPDKARPYYLQAVNNYEDSLVSTKGERARSAIYSTLGEVYFGAGEILKAEENYRAAIQLTPQRADLYYNLAQIYEIKGDVSGAVDAYKKEVEIDPANFKAFNNLGLIYRNTNRLNEAVFCFEKVVELEPQDPRGYILLASTLQRMGRGNDAGRVMQQAQQNGIQINR